VSKVLGWATGIVTFCVVAWLMVPLDGSALLVPIPLAAGAAAGIATYEALERRRARRLLVTLLREARNRALHPSEHRWG